MSCPKPPSTPDRQRCPVLNLLSTLFSSLLHPSCSFLPLPLCLPSLRYYSLFDSNSSSLFPLAGPAPHPSFTHREFGVGLRPARGPRISATFRTIARRAVWSPDRRATRIGVACRFRDRDTLMVTRRAPRQRERQWSRRRACRPPRRKSSARDFCRRALHHHVASTCDRSNRDYASLGPRRDDAERVAGLGPPRGAAIAPKAIPASQPVPAPLGGVQGQAAYGRRFASLDSASLRCPEARIGNAGAFPRTATARVAAVRSGGAPGAARRPS